MPLTPDFDDAVIGSSPMMLMQAQELAARGRRIVVLDRNARPGGAWQTASVQGGEVLETEIACHVIEAFPGIYALLSRAAGVPFVRLDRQPIRIHPSGLRVRYFSRVLLAVSGLRMALVYLMLSAKQLLGLGGDESALINFRTKFLGFLRYQAPYLIRRAEMEGPRDGFVDFLEKLIARCREAGVVFRQMDVTGLTRADGLWHIAGGDGAGLAVQRVHVTTATNLRRISPGVFQNAPVQEARRMALVAGVARDAIVENHTYVAFWKDPDVARISRIDMPGGDTAGEVRFLVEFRAPWTDDGTREQTLARTRMVLARIAARPEDVRILGHVDCLEVRNVDQLPHGRIDQDFYGYFSSGNLAAGLASWQKGHPGLEAGGSGA